MQFGKFKENFYNIGYKIGTDWNLELKWIRQRDSALFFCYIQYFLKC
jgi:hypothetical protein